MHVFDFRKVTVDVDDHHEAEDAFMRFKEATGHVGVDSTRDVIYKDV
jgi:hypothetical protein